MFDQGTGKTPEILNSYLSAMKKKLTVLPN